MGCERCCWTKRPCDCECHARDREQAELRRLRAACESMAEQLERAEATPRGLGATLPSEPLDAAAKQIPSLRGWCRREALMLRAALKGEL